MVAGSNILSVHPASEQLLWVLPNRFWATRLRSRDLPKFSEKELSATNFKSPGWTVEGSEWRTGWQTCKFMLLVWARMGSGKIPRLSNLEQWAIHTTQGSKHGEGSFLIAREGKMDLEHAMGKILWRVVPRDNWMLLQNRRRGFWWGRERIMCMPRKPTKLHSVMACQAFCHNTSPGKSHTAHRSRAWLVHDESPPVERRLPSARQRGSDRGTGRWRCSCLSQGRETQCSH